MKTDPETILSEMAETFKERGKIYGDNYLKVGAILNIMFPDGITLTTIEEQNKYQLFVLKIVKMTRFSESNLTHKDSIRDDAVYGAMLESLL